MDRPLIFNTRTGNRRHVIELNVYRPYGIAKKKKTARRYFNKYDLVNQIFGYECDEQQRRLEINEHRGFRNQ